MKGTLLKNEKGEWIVEYLEFMYGYDKDSGSNELRELPLHPNDVNKMALQINWLLENKEVEFEIINGQRTSSVVKRSNFQHELQDYAKLISKQGSFDEEGFGVTRVIYDKKEDSKITRLEVIDHSPEGKGRAYSKHDIKSLELSYQDDGKTLKIFIK